jgi:erythromycin esterase
MTVDEWITREAVAFALEQPAAAIDQLMHSLGSGVELLGFGEALHGGEEILVLRNRMFERLVEAHGFTAIAIESSFPRARLVNEYIGWRGARSYEDIRETGFGHAFGALEANRELVECMRAYNADAVHATKLHFYGFDIPTGAMGIGSPRQVLEFAADYLGGEFRERIEPLLGDDARWENPAAYMDASKSIALSPEAAALRIAVEDLVNELRTRRPELIARSSAEAFEEALHYARVARELLNFHAALASRKKGESPARVLSTRDASMADNLSYIVRREKARGRVLAFAHNGHLQRGRMTWPGQNYWGTDEPCEWWPAGSHLATILGKRYAVIGTAVGESDENGIAKAEEGTLEARMTAAPGPVRFIPAHDATGIDALPIRSRSALNNTYTTLSRQSLTDFDWLAVLDSVTYQRGGIPLQTWSAAAAAAREASAPNE